MTAPQLTHRQREALRDRVLCPNQSCGYRGPGDRRPRASLLVFFLLLFFGIVPGLIYVVAMSGHTLSCPRCGMDVRRG
jgi:hypothetical protein